MTPSQRATIMTPSVRTTGASAPPGGSSGDSRSRFAPAPVRGKYSVAPLRARLYGVNPERPARLLAATVGVAAFDREKTTMAKGMDKGKKEEKKKPKDKKGAK